MTLTNENVIHIFGEKIDYMQFRKLLEYKDIITHAYTLRSDTINYGPNLDKDTCIRNYKYLTDELGIDVNNLMKPRQKHTSNVKIIDVKEEGKSPDIGNDYLRDTDGLVTNKNDIILATTNADCILFILFDPVNRVIANIHSGWRGSLKGIVIKGLKLMHGKYNSNYEDIICCICPAIHKCCFEVDREVRDMFYKEFKDLGNIDEIIEGNGDKYHIDTILLNSTLMLELGLLKENIIDSDICSVCSHKYINSYRWDKDNYKLSTAVVMLNGNKN